MPARIEGSDPNPSGLCLCGCGHKVATVRVGRSSEKGFRYPAGSHRRYLVGHGAKRKGPEYLVDPITGCWIWQGSKHWRWGYGHLAVNRRIRSAHCVYYERLVGPIPEGLELDHTCHRRDCVNPKHLEPVTPAINTRRSQVAKLTEEKVKEIRRLRADGVPRRDVAAQFNVTEANIKAITTKLTWRDI